MTSFPALKHSTLNATFIPAKLSSHYQFRGIKYASVKARFEHSVPVDDWCGRTVDCRKFGPVCPQILRDLRPFFSIPVEQEIPSPVPQDEFECLNLVVSVPDSVLQNPAEKAPVMIYVHGGGHGYTMVNIEQGFTDPTEIIKTSMQLGNPIVTVHISYRLNIFGYGVFGGMTNFGFHDQKRAIEWVQKHISEFGGDPGNITLVGESAGAIAVHGHIHGPSATKGVKRAILQSGSLYLTGPNPQRVGEAIMNRLVSLSGTKHLRTLPVDAVLAGIQKLGIRNWWLHEEENVFIQGFNGNDWPISSTTELEAIMIGDCQWESRGFEAHLVAVGLEKLEEIFHSYKPVAQEIIELYGIHFSSMDVARSGISAFINDLKFAFATQEIPRMESGPGGRTCYRYLVDQPNPWNKSAGAHHAVDLLFLFGGRFDFSQDTQATKLAGVIREKWVRFLNGESPWDADEIYAFGPDGDYGTISEEELGRRRRIGLVNGLKRIGWARCQPLVTRLLGARGFMTEIYD